MKLHKNSQKRYYFKDAIYFITTVTENRFPYFKCELFCKIFINNLHICREIHQFELFGYKINPDHVHLMIRPFGESNYSMIMHNLKRTTSLHINQILSHPHEEGEDIYPRLLHGDDGNRFKWQKSFHDHIIRDEDDFRIHLWYIKKQWIKHGLEENLWCYVIHESEDIYPRFRVSI